VSDRFGIPTDSIKENKTMGYERLAILRSYKTNKNNIVNEFYLPALHESVLYKRAVGFFSSTALIELSKGIADLIKNGGKIRFIVSPLLSQEDIDAIQRGYDARKIIDEALMREFRDPESPSEKERLNWLAYLIASNRLEIKVAFTPPQKTTGMYHEKIGIIYDELGNKIAFTGSMNETINAFHNNYESIVVFNSLVGEDRQRVEDLEKDFDSLWAGRETNIQVLEFPAVIKERLLSYNKSEIDLMLKITEFSDMMSKAVSEYAPHKVCAFIYELSNAFNAFYHENKIVTEENLQKKSEWITLLKLVLGLLSTGIEVLGFEAPDRM